MDQVAELDPWTVVSRDERLERQVRARAAAERGGFAALVVYSHGAGSIDMCADVLYLTNHYSQMPHVGDEVGFLGSARAHGVCLIPVNGPTTLVVDTPYWRRDLVVADDVREAIHVTGAVADAIRGSRLENSRIGLVGASYMTASAYIGLRESLPEAEFVLADRMVEGLRIRKTPSEISLIRRSTALGTQAMEAVMNSVCEGATEAEAVAEGSRVLLAGGGVMGDCLCASGPYAHEYFHSRLPSADATRRMRRGEIFHVDFYGSYGGYFFDFARTRVVGDDPTSQQRDLLETAISCVEAVCSQVRPGIAASDLHHVWKSWLSHSSLAVAMSPPEDADNIGLAGHGLGLMWEAPWLIPTDSTHLEPGMYLAVEVTLGHPRFGGALFEHNGLVSDNGFEVLTPARARWP